MFLEQVLAKMMSRDACALAQRSWGMKDSRGKALSADSSVYFQKRKDVWGKQERFLEAAFRLGLGHF